MISLGIAGARRGQAFLRSLETTGFELTAAMDPDAQALNAFSDEAGLRKAQRFTRYEDLLGAGIDAVLISSPMPYHAEQAIMALERNVHVLSEVTAAISVDQCLRLREAARDSKAAYMMAENYIYTRSSQIVGEMVRRRVLGEPYYAEGEYLHDVRELGRTRVGEETWRAFWQLGRRGITYPTHALGPILHWLEDRVTSLSARGTGNHTDRAFRGDDTAVMLCETAKGALVRIRTDLHSRRPHNMYYLQLQGTEGCYEAPRGLGDDHKVYVHGRHEELEWHPLHEFEDEFLPDLWREHSGKATQAGHGGGDFFELLEFAQACEGKPPTVDVYAAINWTLPGLLSEVSIERGGDAVHVPDARTDELDRAAAEERASGKAAFLEELLKVPH